MADRQRSNVQSLLNQIQLNMTENQKEISELNRHINAVDRSQKDFNTQNTQMESQAAKLNKTLNDLANQEENLKHQYNQ